MSAYIRDKCHQQSNFQLSWLSAFCHRVWISTTLPILEVIAIIFVPASQRYAGQSPFGTAIIRRFADALFLSNMVMGACEWSLLKKQAATFDSAPNRSGNVSRQYLRLLYYRGVIIKWNPKLDWTGNVLPSNFDISCTATLMRRKNEVYRAACGTSTCFRVNSCTAIQFFRFKDPRELLWSFFCNYATCREMCMK